MKFHCWGGKGSISHNYFGSSFMSALINVLRIQYKMKYHKGALPVFLGPSEKRRRRRNGCRRKLKLKEEILEEDRVYIIGLKWPKLPCPEGWSVLPKRTFFNGFCLSLLMYHQLRIPFVLHP